MQLVGQQVSIWPVLLWQLSEAYFWQGFKKSLFEKNNHIF